MSLGKRSVMVVTLALVAALVVPAIAQAATIYVNKGVAGAALGMKDTAAAKKLGTVKKKYKDTSYDEVIWVRCFGTKKGGHWSLELYSNGSGKVTAFIAYASKYKTKKGIHTGSTIAALKKAYGKQLKKGNGFYSLSASTGHTNFNYSGSKITSIWIWK